MLLLYNCNELLMVCVSLTTDRHNHNELSDNQKFWIFTVTLALGDLERASTHTPCAQTTFRRVKERG